MSPIDRRGLITRLALAAPLAATAACHPMPSRGLRFAEPEESGADVELVALEAELDAVWAAETALWRDLPFPHTDEEWERCSRGQQRTAAVVDRIEALSGRDLRTLRLKARALAWAESAHFDEVDLGKVFDPKYRNTRLMGRIVQDLLATGGVA